MFGQNIKSNKSTTALQAPNKIQLVQIDNILHIGIVIICICNLILSYKYIFLTLEYSCLCTDVLVEYDVG